MLRNKLLVYGDQDGLKVPAHLNYGQYMLQRFLSFGGDIALIDSTTGEELSYSSLAQQIVDISLSLTRMGIRKGDVVGICSITDRMEYTPTLYGIICAGATVTSVPDTGKGTIAHRLGLSMPKMMFCSMETYENYAEVLREAGVEIIVVFDDQRRADAVTFKEFLTEHAMVEDFIPMPVEGSDDIHTIAYSSGTTGMPKGVLISHLSSIVDAVARVDTRYYRRKRVLASTDYYQFNVACLHAGATVVFRIEDKAKVFVETVEKYRIEILQAFPSILLQIVKESSLQSYDVSSVQRVITGGSRLDAELHRKVKNRFCQADVYQAYGCTETGLICSDELAPLGVKPGSVGCPQPAVIIKVVDLETREILGPHQRGELCVQTARMFKGYIGLESQHLDAEGFYRTGDVGYYDEDRYFYIVDRIKDIIKRNDFTVCPGELEAVLLKHCGVLEAAVVGVPHAVLREAPLAFVVTHSDVTAAENELLLFVNTQVSEWMSLHSIRFVSSLPRGRRGKIDRKALREIAVNQQ